MEELKINRRNWKMSRFGERTEENLEYICESCSHRGWSIRSSMLFREGADQANNRQKQIVKIQFAALLGSARILRKVLDLPD